MRGDLDDILAEKGAEVLLLYSESFRNANMYYLTRFLAPDPLIFFKKVDSDPVIVINQMFEAVLEAKDASIDALQAGALGSDVYNLCCDVLEKTGYETTKGRKQIKRGGG